MRSYVAIGFAVIGLLAARPADSFAQDSVLAELYGHGVHAYFAGNYQDAHTYLTTAIDQGTRDPRTFYFRGLAYTALGRPDEAKTDFQKGAELETTGADRVYPVSTSLQRVQGTSRIEIERQRQLARLAARTRTVRASQARYEQLQNAEGQVLRNPSRPQPASAKELVGTPPAQDTSDPFGGDAQPVEPEPAPAETATTEPADNGTDLFGDSNSTDAMPADAGDAFGTDASTDPFADDAAPATEGAAPADAPASDPFADPFG
ncbi:MAG: tetratricopeptide repeat protein [Planctomycetaceae bacterium]|nr:tetratricopeptide repeat protein [Planctomycetales bacterium]MCB9922830.1 tetratricopeptide repeat protein [Planctomycetaceae bacterium]